MGFANSKLKNAILKNNKFTRTKSIFNSNKKSITPPEAEEYDSDDSIDHESNQVFSAVWLDGEREYRKFFYPWTKGRSPPINVMLKALPNSADKVRDLLNE
ncbi:13617_t:CDS:2, partial [Racocetra fulgida]